MLFHHDNYHAWSPGATFEILLVQLFKTVHLPCSTGGLAFFLNVLRAGGYCVASFVLFFMWFNVLYYHLSSCVMMRRCYESIFGIISRGQMLNYPLDLFCGVVAVTVVMIGLVGTYFTWLHHFNTCQDDCEEFVVTLIWLGLLGKMVIHMFFILWQSVLLNGSFIAATTVQTTVDDATIPQFNRELPQLQWINVVLFLDQLMLILFSRTLTVDLQLFNDSRWLLIAYYVISLALIYRVRSRLQKAITTTSEDGGKEQEDATWFEACKENAMICFNFLMNLCPDHHMGVCLLIHVGLTLFTILLSAYSGNNDCFLRSVFHFSTTYLSLRVNYRLWRECTNRTDVTFHHFILALPVLGIVFYILWNLNSCSGEDRELWYFCLILNVVMTAVSILHEVYLMPMLMSMSSADCIVKQAYVYSAAVFTTLSLSVFLLSIQAECFSWFNPALWSFLLQFLLLVVVLLFPCVWYPKETTPQQDSGGMANASVHNGTHNTGSTVDSGTSFSHQPPVNPSHKKQD